MANENDPASNQPGQPVPPEGAGPAASAPEPAPKRKRRRWPYVILGIVLALALLVLMAPKIASTSAARGYVLGKVNENLNGTVEAKDWSLSWTGGIDVSGIRVLDAEKRLVAEIAHVHTDLSLLDAMKGRYHCGKTTVDDANLAQLIIRPDGSTNLDDLTRKSAPTAAHHALAAASSEAPSPAPKAKSESASLPDVSGDFTLNRPRGMVLDQRTNQSVFLDPASAVHVKVASLDQPIENAIAAVFRVGSNGAPGTVKLDGTAQVAKGGKVDLDNAAIDEKLTLAGVPLESANAFLALADQDVVLKGTANGVVGITTKGGNELSVDGDVTASQFAVSGEPLNGETYATTVLKVPVKVVRTVGGGVTRLKIDTGVKTDHLELAVTGDTPQEALLRVLKNEQPGAEGRLTESLRIANLKGIADQLPKTLGMLPGVKLESGSLYQELNVEMKPKGAYAHLQTDLQNVTGTRDGQRIALDPISQSADVTLPEISDLSVYLGSAFLTVEGGGKTLAETKLNGTMDLPALRKQLGQFVDFGKVELAGTGKFTVTTKGDPSQAAAPIATDFDANFIGLKVTGIEGQKPIDEPTLGVKAGALLRRDAENAVAGVDDLHADAKGSFFDVALKNGKLQLSPEQKGGKAPTFWEMLRSAELDATVQLPKAYDYVAKAEDVRAPLAVMLAQADQPAVEAPRARGRSGKTQAARRTDTPNSPVPTTGVATTQPLPPLKFTDGVATVHLALAREASKTLIKNSTVVVERLAFSRGAASYAAPKEHPRTIDLKLDGALETVGEQLRGITLNALDGTLVGGALKLASPVNVTGLSGDGAMKAAGELSLAGKLTDLTTLLDALAAKQPGEAYPYAGDYALTQKLDTQGDVVGVAGSVTVSDLKVMDGKTPAKTLVTEPKLALANDLRYDGVKKDVAIQNLKLDMQGTDALHLGVTGGVQDLGKRQKLDNVKVSLAYDLEKLWPLVGPMLPDTQQDLRESKVTGKFTREFTASGAYPAGQVFKEAVKSLTANGGLAVGTFDGMGINLGNVDLKFALAGGKVTLSAPPADFNKGKLNLNGLAVDLTGDDPRATTPKDLTLVDKATINTLLGDTLGKYINPVFPNSKRAQGLLTVTVNYCEGVALGDAMRTPRSGRAKIVFSIIDMDIANPLGSQMIGGITQKLSVVPGLKLGALDTLGQNQADAFDGQIENGVITLEGGKTTQDITIQLVDPATTQPANRTARGATTGPAPMQLQFQGDVALDTLSQNIKVSLPPQLVAKFIPVKNVGPTLVSVFPSGIPLSLKGTTTKAEIDYGDMVDRFVKEGAVKSLLGGIEGKGGKDGKEKPEDVVGGLLDALGKNKKKDKKD